MTYSKIVRPGILILSLLAALSLFSLSIGTVYTPISEVISSLFKGLLHRESLTTSTNIIISIRLPRLLTALIVGGSLAGAGSIFQCLIRNPLGDPYLIGVSSGATLGIVAAASAGLSSLIFGLPAAAVIGGAAALLVVYILAKKGGKVNPIRLILAGIVVSAFFSSLAMFILSRSDSITVKGIMFWMMGDLGYQNLERAVVLLPIFFIALIPVILLSGKLNVIMLGDDIAGQMGIMVEKIKAVSLLCAALLTGLSVAAAGAIGFIGLVVPNFIRMIWGSDFRINLPLSVLAGAALLLCADILVRILTPLSQMPVGIITALIGAPFFIHLLLKEEN